MTRSKMYVVMATCLAVAGVGYGAYAQTGLGTPPSMIPYHGYLEDAAGPIDGDRNLTFFITDQPNVALSGALWSEPRTVTFSNGYFSVALGEQVSIPATTFNQPERYLRVQIDGNTLLGAQRLLATPYAITAQVASPFTVVNLNASGTATVGSPTFAATEPGDLSVGEDLEVDDQARIRTGLLVGPSGSIPTGGGVTVSGDLTVLGNITASGATNFTGTVNLPNTALNVTSLNVWFVDSSIASRTLLSSTSAMCFLTQVAINDNVGSGNGSTDSCSVAVESGSWVLRRAGDSSTECRASCLSW